MEKRTASCECGKVTFETLGEPILAGVCYCDDCQAGCKMLEELPDAPPAMDEDGGSNYLTFRDDRVTITSGEKLIKSYKLKEKAPTKRYVASCCNSALYVKFSMGHWKSTFRNRYISETPPVEIRSQTQFRTSSLPFPDNAPTYKKFPLSLFGKLIKARIAMAFGR